MIVTRLGWTTATVGVTATIAGFATGWAALIAIGVCCLLLIGAAGLWLIGTGSLDTDLSVSPERVTVGDAARLAVRVRNRAGRRVPALALEIDVDATPVIVPLPSLAPGARHATELELPTDHRGVLQIGPIRNVRRDPLGLLRREQHETRRLSLIVHPRTVRLAGRGGGVLRDLEGRAVSELTASDLSFHAIRDYHPGDDRRTIHWKSTAKTGSHMVRQYEQTHRSRVAVLVAARATDRDAYELVVSAGASIALRAMRASDEVQVITGDAHGGMLELPAFGTTRLLDAMAALQPGERSPGLERIARSAGRRIADASSVIMVAGPGRDARRLARITRFLPPRAAVSIVVCDPGVVPGAARIGPLSVVSIGYLDDLPTAMRRAA